MVKPIEDYITRDFKRFSPSTTVIEAREQLEAKFLHYGILPDRLRACGVWCTSTASEGYETRNGFYFFLRFLF